ncbi:MAG: hypothetical protein ACFFBI_04365, partial [Promethearchaeota archaeon]
MPINITDYGSKKASGLKKKHLERSPNLKKTFTTINQHLYGKLKYTDTDTRTRSKQIINLLLCKLIDEIDKDAEDFVEFCIRDGESNKELYDRIREFF